MKDWKLPLLLAAAVVLGACSSNSTTADSENAEAGKDAVSSASNAPAAARSPAPAAPAVPTAPGASTSAPPNRETVAPAKVESVKVPVGTALQIVLNESLSSGKNKAGDEFTGSVALPVSVNGVTIIEKGAQVHGKVVDAEDSGRVKGLANMRLTLTEIRHNGKFESVETNSMYTEAETTKGRDAAVIGGAAGVGAVIGAIAGGKKGAATGAAIGGGAGTGTVLATKGKEVEFPSESTLSFTLEKELKLNP